VKIHPSKPQNKIKLFAWVRYKKATILVIVIIIVFVVVIIIIIIIIIIAAGIIPSLYSVGYIPPGAAVWVSALQTKYTKFSEIEKP